MEEKNLREKINEFLETQTPKFSQAWGDEIQGRLSEFETSYATQHIRSMHNRLLTEMLAEGKGHLFKHFPNLEVERVEDILQEAMAKWIRYFNPEKNGERQFFKVCVISANIDEYNKENPVTNREVIVDSEGQQIIGKSGKPLINQIRAKRISTDFYKIENDDPEETDDSFYHLVELATSGANSNFDSDSDQKLSDDFETLSRANRLLIAMAYDDRRNGSEAKLSNLKKKKLKPNVDAKITTAQLLYRYYLLKNLVTENGVGKMPHISGRLIPKQAFIDSISSNDLQGDNVTGYQRYRHSIIKNAKNLQFMELCISVLKEGLGRFEREIKEEHFEDEDKNKIPMLSAVAADEKGKLIDFCFKGQIESYNPQGQRRTFQKHCEYSILEEIIEKKTNSELLRRGSLYVTLEPCNMRTYYCLNPNCNTKCDHSEVELKIPCAVRCLESGVVRVFIGSVDTNKSVERKGEEILRTGRYKFNLLKGNFTSEKREAKENHRDVRSQKLLEQYFVDKGYELEISDSTQRVYRINDGVDVIYFPPDLVEEICELNGTFLKHHNDSYYY
jgi:pyrimidine deaminase RibD-like protein